MINNKQKLNLFTFLMLLFFANGFAQIVQKIGDNSFTIDPNAVLELESTNKGLLLPRLPLTSTSSILPMTGTLTAGMTVYNTATTGDVTPGFYYYNGTKWVRVADSSSVPASSITGTVAVINGGTGATTAAGALFNLGAQSESNLSSNVTTDTGSTSKYPSVSAVESYVATQVANATPDATTLAKGKVQLAGDLAGTAALPEVAPNAITSAKILDGTIVNADISALAAIDDTKLATIATPLKVSNSATTATANNTVSTIVLRDGSGNFSAGDITATSFIGNGSNLTNVTATSFSGTLGVANGGTGATTAAGALTNLGAQSASNLSSNVTTDTGSTSKYPSVSAVETYVTAQATANATPDATTLVKGKVQLAGDLAGTAESPAIAAGAVTSAKILDGTIVNDDISALAAIADTKLATIATAGKVSNSATTATKDNENNTIVLRDGSGNFSAGAITATSFTGNGSGLTNVTATSFSGTLGVANGGTGVTTSTGTGSVVLSTSPTLVTPDLGTPSALVGTNITGTAAGLSIGGNAATATTAVSFSGSLAGDVTGTQGATTVGKINGTSLAGLSTGLLKNTTTTGVPTIALAGTDYVIPSALGSYLPLTGGSLSGSLTSTVATGTAPFIVTSTTAVTNLSIGGNAATATNAANANITSDIASTTFVYPTFVQSNTPGNLPLKMANSTKLAFVPSTGILYATGFSGTATNATNINISSDVVSTTAVYPTFVTGSGGFYGQRIATTKLSFVPSTGILTASGFSGNGSGLTNITSTTNANLTGVVTSIGNNTAIADGALTIAKTSGLQTAIDAKVADAIIDASTTVAPSQNAVFDALALKATIAAPTFTGDAKAVTATAGDNDTSIATTEFVTTALTTAVNSPSIVAKDANYTATPTDSTILFDTSTATVAGYTLTIPAAAAGNSGKIYIIRKVDASYNKLNFSPPLKLTSSVEISSVNYAKTFRIQSDGSKWNIID